MSDALVEEGDEEGLILVEVVRRVVGSGADRLSTADTIIVVLVT